MRAKLSLPTHPSLTLKLTLTSPALRSMATVSTSPTLTPAMRTSSPSLRFAEVSNMAEYGVPPPMSGRLPALKAANSSATMKTSPMAPIGVGLREVKDLPTRAARLVLTGLV